MRRPTCVTVAVALLLGLGLPWTSAAASSAQPMADVIVVLHDGQDARTTARDMARSYEARVGHVYEHVLAGFAAEVPERRLEGLRRDPRVDFVSANGVVNAVAETEPTGVRRIDADDVRSTATGAGVRVAILDTGIDLDHPDLEANIGVGSGKNCITPDTPPDDDHGHGTHVAGTVAAVDDQSGVVGVAPGATLMPFKVLDGSGSGTWTQVICGIDEAVAQQADVINLSLGDTGSYTGLACGSSGDALFEAICRGITAGVTFTVAAGNDAKDASGFIPAAHPDVITVSAYADTDGIADGTVCSGRGLFKTCDETFASFSNYGDIVDVMAPGVSILSTVPGGGTGTKSGTSMAAPHVAGVVALMIEHHRSASTTDLTPAAIAARLQDRGQCPDHNENAGTGDCVGQGAWSSDRDTIAEPMVNAAWTLTSSNPPPIDDGGGDDGTTGISLTASGRKVKGQQQIDLKWSGAASTNVDVYEGDAVVATTANGGAYTYVPGRSGGGTYTYKVCEAGTKTCSNSATVTF